MNQQKSNQMSFVKGKNESKKCDVLFEWPLTTKINGMSSFFEVVVVVYVGRKSQILNDKIVITTFSQGQMSITFVPLPLWEKKKPEAIHFQLFFVVVVVCNNACDVLRATFEKKIDN